jgi:hypothetical protein
VHLDAATILLQWAVGGLAFGWVTTRRREVSLGYGWLLRIVYGSLALLAFGAELRSGHHGVGHAVFLVTAAGVVLAAAVALAVSVVRRGAGVSGAHERAARAAARVAAMTAGGDTDEVTTGAHGEADAPRGKEFPPALDLPAPLIGAIGLVAAAQFTGGAVWLTAVRLLVGAAFLGVVTDAMLLGHWYLTQPGLPRAPLLELVRWLMIIWPFEVILLLIPVGMVSVLNGTIDDGYQGMLGWFWVACAVTTIGLCFVTRAALRERQYSAVMAATGLLYLAILTAFVTDLVARALLNA